MKTIKVEEFKGLQTISWKELKKNFEPNALKDKNTRNIGDLKDSILSVGFITPFFIWVKGKYIVDGAGRFMALEMLEYEGYEIPDLYFISISAKTKKEAKEKVMYISSKYGKETYESVQDFMIDMPEMDLSFVSIEGIDVDELDISLKPKKEEKKKLKGKTIFKHQCPNCKFEF